MNLVLPFTKRIIGVHCRDAAVYSVDWELQGFSDTATASAAVTTSIPQAEAQAFDLALALDQQVLAWVEAHADPATVSAAMSSVIAQLETM